LLHEAREKNIKPRWQLPRPMIKSDDFDFSFSGIKTAVLYQVKKLYDNPEFVENDQLKPEIKLELALEFENAVTEVLIAKTKKALEKFQAKSLILGGGVIANTFIRNSFKKLIEEYPDVKLFIPETELSTDNAVMIAIAGYIDYLSGKKPSTVIVAQGNLSL
jgi:N6-L-threonylcarbamoyladenine synthase